MAEGNSRRVISNQCGLHENLDKTVMRHLEHEWRQPIADRSRKLFDQANEFLARSGLPLILDSCCGTGDSSRLLASRFPDHAVIGFDKSDSRITRERAGEVPENLLLLRADLNDIFRLAVEAGLRPERHYILYPNPWPKAAHLKRRWHGAPVFPWIVRLSGRLELRSNWRTYLDEFSRALELAGKKASVEEFQPDGFMTPFERKYHSSGQALYRLVATLDL